MFGAMAAMLVAALCVPGGVRRPRRSCSRARTRRTAAARSVLRMLAARDDPMLRSSVGGICAGARLIGVGAADRRSAPDGALRRALWALALRARLRRPSSFGIGGLEARAGSFRGAPRADRDHRAGRVDRRDRVGLGGRRRCRRCRRRRVLGMAIAAALWWLYFDVVALVAARRLARATAGPRANEIARDSYSYLHFPMIAGIVLLALGLKKTIGSTSTTRSRPSRPSRCSEERRSTCLAHVASGCATSARLNRQRLACAGLLVALIPLATEVDPRSRSSRSGRGAHGA